MHLTVHPERCMSSGVCQRAVPEVFGHDRDGWVRLLDRSRIPEFAEDVLDAAEACPTGAIEIGAPT